MTRPHCFRMKNTLAYFVCEHQEKFCDLVHDCRVGLNFNKSANKFFFWEKNLAPCLLVENHYTDRHLTNASVTPINCSIVDKLARLIHKLCLCQPSVSRPDVSRPNISKPNVSWPNVIWPDASWPDVSWPDVSWPNVSWPNVSWPDVSWPNVSWPDVSQPNVSLPNVIWQDVSRPNCFRPDDAEAKKHDNNKRRSFPTFVAAVWTSRLREVPSLTPMFNALIPFFIQK